MGLFDFGGSSSRSRSQSQSSSFDNLDQVGFNFGQSESAAVGGSQSSSVSTGGSVGRSRSTQDIAFSDIFSSLFSGASAAAARIDPGAITGAANRLFNSGSGFLDTLAGGGEAAGLVRDRIQSDGVADEQIDLLEADISEFLNESVLPGITSRGVAASTLGGSRDQLQRGLAGEAALEEFARGAVDIRTRDQDRRDSLAVSFLGDESGRATAGVSALPSLFGLAEAGELAALSPFAALSRTIGGPTVLTDAESASSSENFATSLADSFNRSLSSAVDFGFDQTIGRAGSQSTSSSKSKSKSASFGFA